MSQHFLYLTSNLEIDDASQNDLQIPFKNATDLRYWRAEWLQNA